MGDAAGVGYRDEKLKIVEALWSDLTAEGERFDSPVWHKAELRNSGKLRQLQLKWLGFEMDTVPDGHQPSPEY